MARWDTGDLRRGSGNARSVLPCPSHLLATQWRAVCNRATEEVALAVAPAGCDRVRGSDWLCIATRLTYGTRLFFEQALLAIVRVSVV